MAAILPVASLAMSAVGTGMSIAGAAGQSQAQQRIIQQQQAIEVQRQKAMEIDGRRRKLEEMRTMQRAAALATVNATSQGAEQGSGLAGGLAQIQGQTNFNQLGVDQNLSLGRSIFAANSVMSQDKIDMANANQLSSLGAGISSLGGSLGGSFRAASNVFSGFGGSSQPSNPYNQTGSLY